MDTSQKYIDMCREAEEIQALRPIPKTYNDSEDYAYTSFFYLPEYDRIRVLKWDNDECHPIIGEYFEKESNAIWLPRQDQLQEILDWISKYNICLIPNAGRHYNLRIDDWTSPFLIKTKYTFIGDSFEQLWLAFVMAEKYNKAWNGKNWISINKENIL